MTLRFTEKKIGTITFDEDTTNGGGNGAQGFKIPRDKPIRRIILRFFIEVTNGGAGVLDQDGILNVIKSIKLEADGSDILTHLDGRIAYFLEQYEKGTTPYFVDGTEATATATAFVTLMLDFATNRKLEKDVTALLMAHRFSSLNLFIDWGAVADAYSTTTGTTFVDANSGCQVEIKEVAGTIGDGTGGTNIRDTDPIQIIESIKTIDLEVSKLQFDDNAQEIDVTPSPSSVMTNLFMVLDNDQRTNDRVTDIKIQRQSPETENIITREWLNLWSANKTEYSIETLQDGVLLVDYLDKLGAGGLRNFGNQGDLKYLLLTDASVSASQDDIVIFTRSVSSKAKPKK